jgi:hypothetical protein
VPLDPKLEAALGEQITLLKRSVKYFLGGDLTEVLRIATILRVLAHQTTRSHALLQQIDPDWQQWKIRDNAQLRSLMKPIGDRVTDVEFYYAAQFRVHSKTGDFRPYGELGAPSYFETTLGEWWQAETAVIHEEAIHAVFTRRQLVLTLANKEGGAHVDISGLSADYEALISDSKIKVVVNGIAFSAPNIARTIVGKSGLEMLWCLEKQFPQFGRLVAERFSKSEPQKHWIYIDSPLE